jgi:hypothetical protein
MAAVVPSIRQPGPDGSAIYDGSGKDEALVKRTSQQTFAIERPYITAQVDKVSSASTTAAANIVTKTVTVTATTTAKTSTAKSSTAKSSTAKTTSTKTTSTKTSTKDSSAATASSSVGSLVLTSNTDSYGETELTADLESILEWADDEDNLTSAEKVEVVAALLSASARYYPEMPTEAICRIMLADIRAESDFIPTEVSGARLDSGSSWGLLQVSPNGASQEWTLFAEQANVLTHNFTDGMPDDVRAGIRGPLIDYETGVEIDFSNLSKEDLFRPWINIHVAMWIQSNLARTTSQDPSDWAAINDYSWQLKEGTISNSTAKVEAKWVSLLAESTTISTTIRTGLGSWVAGPADDDGGYLTSGDDVSVDYLTSIMEGVRHLYGVTDKSDMPKSWLETYTLNAGLVDYNTYY